MVTKNKSSKQIRLSLRNKGQGENITYLCNCSNYLLDDNGFYLWQNPTFFKDNLLTKFSFLKNMISSTKKSNQIQIKEQNSKFRKCLP